MKYLNKTKTIKMFEVEPISLSKNQKNQLLRFNVRLLPTKKPNQFKHWKKIQKVHRLWEHKDNRKWRNQTNRKHSNMWIDKFNKSIKNKLE